MSKIITTYINNLMLSKNIYTSIIYPDSRFRLTLVAPSRFHLHLSR